jgi:alpha-2-macroglobulin
MTKKSIMASVSCALILLLAQCTTTTDTHTIGLSSPLPEGVLSRTSALSVSFSRGVVGTDSLNLWTATPYIEFTPSIPGKFVWQDTARLVFSPDAPLPGDTRFRGKLNTALLTSLSGASSFDGNPEFTFSTESFALSTAEFFYDRLGSTRTVGIKANLEFTYAVNPQDVARTITLTIDGKNIPTPRVMTTENSKVIAIEIGEVNQTEKPRDISVSFNDEVVSPETQTRLKMDKPFVFTLPGLEELKIYGHEFGYDGTTSWIRFRTSQEVDLSSAREFLTLDPVRTYTLDGNRQSFTLRGNLEPGTAFRVTVKKGMGSVLGGKTQNEYTADVVFGNIKPSFRFASESGVYMMLAGQKALEIKTVNLPALYVRVSQIFQNNLLFFLDQGRFYDYYWDDEGGGTTRKYRYITGNYGRQLSFDTLAIRSATNQEVSTWFDLTRYLNNGYKGFFVVEIADPAEAWRSTSKLISVSNLGLMVKQSSDELMVFASHLETTQPVAGALITLVSTNNQVIATQNTDPDGVARFPGFRDLRKDFTLKLVTAEADNDFNFLHLPDYRVETSRFDVSGKRDVAHSFDVFLYGDRNIYRPGELVYLSGIVRNLTQPLPVQMPVRLKTYNPRGTVISEQQLTLNEEGSFETQYQTLATSQTGQYRFELWTGNNLFLQSYKVSVEDFVPDRLKINLTASREEARPGDKIVYDLQAFNFFGPPAAGRNWEFEASFDIIPFQSKLYPTFRFADDGATNYTANPEILSGKTNEDGRARVEFALPMNLTSTGLLRARGRVAVFDESGRPVYQLAQTIVYPKQYYIGVLRRPEYYVSPNAPQKMQLVAVDERDAPISGFRARVDLIRYEWHSVLRQHQNSNTLRYVSERREIQVKSDVITLKAAPTEYTYIAPRSGEYVIRVSRDGETGYNQFSFYAYDWATSDATSFAVDPEARVEMVLDKEVYTPGDRAKILFKTPFSGRMLVTIERNRVFSYHYLDVTDNAASLEVPVEESFLPNVYVSAILFRKVGEQRIPLLVGHGFAPIMVEKKSNQLPVTITAPEKIRPKSRQRVTVTAGSQRNIFVTLAAVDEGICQVKNFKTPDPYGYFYAKKALETETYDFFRDLLPEREKSQQSSPGGGDDEAIAKRVNPLGVQRFKPVALWSGIRRTDANGTVEVELDVPEFSGELRLMALAYSGDRFGSAQKGMKVADPVILTPALPRFLSPNDSILMAITAFNTTEKPVSLQFAIDATGAVTVPSPHASLDLGPNQERFVNVPLAATREIGKAVVTVKTSAFGEKIESTTELPVRPVAPFVAEGITGFAEGNTPVSHDIPDVYLPFGRSARITLSPFPVANLAKELSHLIGYPHGCIEQTVSKAFPQIYLRDIAALLAPEILSTGSPAYFVNEAITRVGTMQLADGTFAYWPGGTTSNPWSTVYTTHFLLECRRAGYAVPEMMLSSALAAVRTTGRSKATQDYYTRDQQKTVVRRIADKSVLYALYVLALAGTPEKGLMDYYRNERFLLSTDTQVLLAGTFALSGDRRTYLDLLPPKFVTEDARRTTGLNFDSPVRANALILNTLLDTDLNNPDIPRYLEYLSSTYRSNRWFSTQDDAFTLIAFGKAARMASGTTLEGTITVGDKQYAYPGGTKKLAIDPFGKRVTIVLRGEGRVYYSLVTEGIRTDGAIPVEDRNLQIRRDFLDRSGKPVDIRSVQQNDLIIVKVSLNSSVDNLENIAITDLLPAGFEIENPRLTESTNYQFIKNAMVPEYMDIRDDRINLYTSFRRGTRQQIFYYMVRAVTPGLFAYAPIVAEAMYNADYYSASGGTRVRVER